MIVYLNMDYKVNQYILAVSEKFLKDSDLDFLILKSDIERYIKNCYLKNKPQTYSIDIGDSFIKFHKIDVRGKGISKQKGNRVITFFLLNYDDGFNKIMPVFSFSTQEEKVYNKQLRTPKFAFFLKEKLAKYTSVKNIEMVLDV